MNLARRSRNHTRRKASPPVHRVRVSTNPTLERGRRRHVELYTTLRRKHPGCFERLRSHSLSGHSTILGQHGRDDELSLATPTAAQGFQGVRRRRHGRSSSSGEFVAIHVWRSPVRQRQRPAARSVTSSAIHRNPSRRTGGVESKRVIPFPQRASPEQKLSDEAKRRAEKRRKWLIVVRRTRMEKNPSIHPCHPYYCGSNLLLFAWLRLVLAGKFMVDHKRAATPPFPLAAKSLLFDPRFCRNDSEKTDSRREPRGR